jgi:hypothetical protein
VAISASPQARALAPAQVALVAPAVLLASPLSQLAKPLPKSRARFRPVDQGFSYL